MSKIQKIWRVAAAVPEVQQLASKLGISEITAQILFNREITEVECAKKFLLCEISDIGDPFRLKDMEKAIQRIIAAIQNKQKITIYGDYDVDGITATALVFRVLIGLGAVVDYYIPERQSEGYGLNLTALANLQSAGTELLITVDCGISAITEVSSSKAGLDIIITDHHEPPEALPPAFAIINPKQADCTYPEKQLAGVGVAFKLCQALLSEVNEDINRYTGLLELVAIGTVADIVALSGENRIFVKQGLREIKTTKLLGLKTLLQKCNIIQGAIDTYTIGFIIAPRLNAVGRLSHAKAGVELLTTADIVRAEKLAELLNAENNDRQLIEKKIYKSAVNLIEATKAQEDKVIVLASEDWHSGVIGIVAARILERYYRPVILLTIKAGIAKGSCRSIPGFDIFRALGKCQDLLLQFGGHKAAAGLSLEIEQIPAFKQKINNIAKAELSPNDYIPVLAIDALVALDEINAGFIEQLACLEPYGMGNPKPVFACRNVSIAEIRPIGDGQKHLKMKIACTNGTFDAVAWNYGEIAGALTAAKDVDLAFLPEYNEWQGRRNIQLRAKDLHYYQDTCAFGTALGRYRLFDGRNLGDKDTFLLKILKECKSAAILVDNIKTGRQIYANIVQALPEKSSNIQIVEKDLPELKAVEDNNITIIMSSLRFEGAPNFKNLIYYSMPFSQQLFIENCKAGTDANQSNIYFLFGNADVEKVLQGYSEFAPTRLEIGYVYLALKHSGAENKPIDLTLIEFTAEINTKYSSWITPSGVQLILQILAELDLVSGDFIQATNIALRKVRPGHKLDLAESDIYHNGMLEREKFLLFAEKLLKSPVGTLLSQIND